MKEEDKKEEKKENKQKEVIKRTKIDGGKISNQNSV